MVRRLWCGVMVVSTIVWIGAVAVAAASEWSVTCGVAGFGGIDCVFHGDRLAIVAKTAPARWFGFTALAAAGAIAFTVSVVATIVLSIRRRRVTRATGAPAASRAAVRP
jgi:hypothetical protein